MALVREKSKVFLQAPNPSTRAVVHDSAGQGGRGMQIDCQIFSGYATRTQKIYMRM